MKPYICIIRNWWNNNRNLINKLNGSKWKWYISKSIHSFIFVTMSGRWYKRKCWNACVVCQNLGKWISRWTIKKNVKKTDSCIAWDDLSAPQCDLCHILFFTVMYMSIFIRQRIQFIEYRRVCNVHSFSSFVAVRFNILYIHVFVIVCTAWTFMLCEQSRYNNRC